MAFRQADFAIFFVNGVHGGEKVGHWSGGVMLLRAV